MKQALLELAGGRTLPVVGGRDWAAHLVWLRSLTDSRSELERRFLNALAERHLRLPDEAQHPIPESGCVPYFFYKPNTCIFCDGSVHDGPEQAARDDTTRLGLRARGYQGVTVRTT